MWTCLTIATLQETPRSVRNLEVMVVDVFLILSSKLANVKGEWSNLGIAGQIDGAEALNNILLIGLTNRMDLLDEALIE